MAPWDAEPERNPATGLPYSFTELPVELHLELWRQGPRRLLMQSRYAALLASMHGSRLQRRRDQTHPGVRAYLRRQHEFEQQMIASLDLDRDALERNHQLIWTWDFLSLALCLDWSPATAHDVPSAAGVTELELKPAGSRHRFSLSPWPLATESLTVRCEGRRLEGPYDSDEALRRALARAPWETISFELVPA